MEIKWVILAAKYSINEETGKLSIEDVVHEYDLNDGHEPEKPLCVIAKMNLSPQDTSGEKTIRLDIVHNEERVTYDFAYVIPGLTKPNERVFYVGMCLNNFSFTAEGEYRFHVNVDDSHGWEAVLAYYGSEK